MTHPTLHYPPLRDEHEQKPRLIGNRFTAAIGVALTLKFCSRHQKQAARLGKPE